ncbi:MAG: RNA-directed DNA polymerase, partial [Treponema sp.]|nr:RNA-directed DNA polymerase [Treponema sp.]
MTSEERREARYKRRVEKRKAAKEAKLSEYDNFDRITGFDNLYKAYKRCLLGVGWKESTQRYEADAMRNLIETRRKLLNGESVHKGFVEFDLRERGKARHIRSIHISERVVQKCLCDEALVPILANSLIYDNGASVKNKGVHFALKRLICHMTKFYRQNKSNEGYALMADFKRFFDSVDHGVLFRLLDEKILNPRLRRLTKSFIKVFGNGVSLGLGSQVSQVSAIFLPNKLDHYIKEKLRIKFYGRYMDDLYLIHENKEYLKHCLKEIIAICNELKITVNLKKTAIVKLSHGLVFLKGRYSL